MNKVFLCGNLGQDPEARQTETGRKVVRFSLATTRSYKTKDSDQWKEDTQWHSVVAWDYLAEKVVKHLRKGSKALVTGEVRYRKYTTADGVEKYVTEIISDHVDPSVLVKNNSHEQQYDEPAGNDEPPTDDLPF